MIFSAEAFRINLVNSFGARWPCCEPSVCGSNLDTANGIAISCGLGRDRYRLLARKVSHRNIVCSDVFKSCLLLIGRGRFGPAIVRLAELYSEFRIEFARILLADRSDLCREQRGDNAILVRGPDATIHASKRRSCALLARKSKTAVKQPVNEVFEADRNLVKFSTSTGGDAIDHAAADHGLADCHLFCPMGPMQEEIVDAYCQIVIGWQQSDASSH